MGVQTFTSGGIQRFLKADDHPAITSLPAPKKWTGGNVYKICQTYHKKYLDTSRDIHLTLLQICLILIGVDFLSLAIILFNRLIRSLLPEMNRDPFNVDNDHLHHTGLEAHQRKNKGKDTH